jgi:hypothetical protein
MHIHSISEEEFPKQAAKGSYNTPNRKRIVASNDCKPLTCFRKCLAEEATRCGEFKLVGLAQLERKRYMYCRMWGYKLDGSGSTRAKAEYGLSNVVCPLVKVACDCG